jgi:hypothetical protein
MIYGAQSLAGKILMSKNLQARTLTMKTQNGTMWIHPGVTASPMIAQIYRRHKVRCHTGVVEKL